MAILRLHVQFFFVLCLLVLRARIISWRVSWFPQCILGRHWTREILEPRGFLNQHRSRCHFPRLCPSCRLRSRPETNLFGFYFGDEKSGFFLACVQFSPPLKLSPRSLRGGGVHRSSPAVSRPPVPGVQIVECGTKEETEKKIRRKKGRGLSPLPHPLFVCLLFFFFLLTSSLRCPRDLNSWNRIVSRARGKLTRKGKKQQQRQKHNNNKQGASRFTRLRLTHVGPLWTLLSTIWTP